ncbi:hypothetical protein FS837_008680 [Tulasnella sp. UAMH 9824]|nr:hypothetical protein FS837_008680 [Tulasnella sp. UAMH 9824]
MVFALRLLNLVLSHRSTIPTAPAAAPPPPPFASFPARGNPAPASHPTSLLRGYLKLVFHANSANPAVYLKHKPDSYGYCTTTSSIDDALRIAYKPSEGRVELLVIDRDNLAQGELFGIKRVEDTRLKRAYLVIAPYIASRDAKIWLLKPGYTTSFLPRLEDTGGAVLRVYKDDHRPVIQWSSPGNDTTPARLEFEPIV